MRKEKTADHDYEEDLQIDPNALDIEFLDQPNLFMKYAKLAAKAKKRVDEAKEKVDLVKAKLDHDIRIKPGVYGIEKVTETVVANAIIQQDEYEAVNKDFLDAKYRADLMQAAVRAFDQRKSALENLVRLLGMEYFSAPREPRDLGKEYLEKGAHGKASGKIKDKLKRREK